MSRYSGRLKLLILGLCALAIAYPAFSIIPPKVNHFFNDLSSWYVYSISKRYAKNIKIVGVAIDEYSLNKIGQRWPWKRPVYAQALKILDKEKVSTVGIDLVFVGESEAGDDDLALTDALRSVSSKVVLAYFFDPYEKAPVYPLAEFKDASYASGIADTPTDSDGKVRRLRSYVEAGGVRHYSFSLMLSAAYLGKKPHEILPDAPLFSDKTFSINYLFKPKDIVRCSFYDLTSNLQGLKNKYGEDFLLGSLVLIYPETKISRDLHNTPLGIMPGGMLHLNGAADIISRKFIREPKALALPFLLFNFICIAYALGLQDFLVAVLITVGTLVVNLWLLIVLSLAGVRFNYGFSASFGILFFIFGSLEKYLSFFAQIIKIKDKATFDPLRSLFTLRYFYYRAGFEAKKIYFGRGYFLLFVYLESFKDASEELSMDALKAAWKELADFLNRRARLWSVYSQDELVGILLSSQNKAKDTAAYLRKGLSVLLKNKKLVSGVKIACVRLKKEYPLNELLPLLSEEIKDKESGELIFLEEEELLGGLELSREKLIEPDRFLESLDQDIEERNRQLLGLIESLKKEHNRTKDAFFQIISSLVNALEARDAYTEGHSERVSKYAVMFAEKLGWNNEEKEKLRKAALLHDLGKIGIPDRILHKNSQLNEEEFALIKRHEIIGVKILEPLKDLADILPWILYHHEKWDGSGYPHGLSAEAIPAASQIIAIADVYDALTTGRDYKVAFSKEDSIKQIALKRGTHFNPQLTDLVIEILTNQHPQI